MTDTTPEAPGDEPGPDTSAPPTEEPAPEEPTSERPDEATRVESTGPLATDPEAAVEEADPEAAEPDEPTETESGATTAEEAADEAERASDDPAPEMEEAVEEPEPEPEPQPEPQPQPQPQPEPRSETEAILGASTRATRDDSADIAAIFGARTAGDGDGDGDEVTTADEQEAETAEAETEAGEAADAGAGDTEVLDEDEVLAESARARRDSPYDRPGKWYVIHSYAGYEKKVQSNLGSRIQSMNMEGKIFEVVIPTENVTEFKQGKRVTVPKKVFPGYLLCRCFLDDDSWYVIRNTPGVTGFVGTGGKPTPLTRKDVENFLQVATEGEEAPKRTKPRLEYEQGETVRVREGPFADFSGEIVEINEERLTVKVLVNIFGRETPVELEFSQVAKL